MRKEVRLGLAAGGVILAILIAWVLLPERDKTAQPIAGNSESDVTAVTPSALTPIAITPATQPTTAPAVVIAPATQPVVAVNGAPRDIWARALETGQVDHTPLMTQTPGSDHMLLAADSGPATRPLSAARTHKIAAGETLASIARATYGNAGAVQRILQANPKLDPRRLRIGTVINLPDADESKPLLASAGTELPSSAAPGAATALDAARTYKVLAGDSLQKIARKLYGKAEMASKIYDLNKAAIGANPAKLKVNMVLHLPEPPTTTATAQ